MVHFSVMDYSLEDEGVKEHWDAPILADHWHFPQFRRTVVPYVIAANCETVRLFLNGKEYALPNPATQPNRMITGFLPWQEGEVRVTGYIGGREVCCHTVRTPDCAIRLQFHQEMVVVPAEHGYQTMLHIHAVDGEGTPCFRESARVRFTVEGPAAVVAVDSGNLMSGESYRENLVHLYHGAASILIAVSGQTGRVKVTACAEGMFAGTCTVIVGEHHAL